MSKFPAGNPDDLSDDEDDDQPENDASGTYVIPIRLDGMIQNLGRHDQKGNTTRHTVQDYYRNYLRGQINLVPPYQRDNVWTESQQRAFIAGLFNVGSPQPPPIYVCCVPEKNRQKTGKIIQRFMLIDGKQRSQCLKKWFENGITIPVVPYRDGKKAGNARNLLWKDMEGKDAYADLLYVLDSREVQLVAYTEMTMDEQEIFFRILNNGTAFSAEEKIYCPNFLARHLFAAVYEHVFGNGLGVVFRTPVRNKDRFKHIRVAHELLFAAAGPRFKDGVEPRPLGKAPLMGSAAALHKLMRENELQFGDPVDMEWVDGIIPGFQETCDQLRKIADRMVPVFLDRGKYLPEDGGIHARNVLDPLSFLYYLVSHELTTLDLLESMDHKKLVAWMERYFNLKNNAGDYKLATNDASTMIAKFDLLARTFYEKVSKSNIPVSLLSDIAAWKERLKGKRGRPPEDD